MTTTNQVGKRARRLAARDAQNTADATSPGTIPEDVSGTTDAPSRTDHLAGPPLTAITTPAEVDDLAAGLYDAHRAQPWVVVTTPFETGDPRHDIEELVAAVRAVARVFTIETGTLTRRLSDELPDRLGVFGGAGRSFPVGFSHATTMSESLLRFSSTAVRRGAERLAPDPRATERLASDALRHAYAAGLFDTHHAEAVTAEGVVTMVSDIGRAIVSLDDGGLASIAQELTYPPIPLDWTVARGQRVSGMLDRDSGRLAVELPTPVEAELVERFPHHGVTLALVRETDADSATLMLHPRLHHEVSTWDISHNPLDHADGLLSVGDVVPARVQHLSDGTLHLSLWDVDDDEPIVAPLSLTAGGPPWLQEGRPLPSASEAAEHVDLAVPAGAGHAAGSLHVATLAVVTSADAAVPRDTTDVLVATEPLDATAQVNAPESSGATEPTGAKESFVTVGPLNGTEVEALAAPLGNASAEILDAFPVTRQIRPAPPGLRPALPPAHPDAPQHGVETGGDTSAVPSGEASGEPSARMKSHRSSSLVESLNNSIAARDAAIRDLEHRLAETSARLGRSDVDYRRLELAKAELADRLGSAQHARDTNADQLRDAQKKLRGARRTASTLNAPTQDDRRARWPDDDSWLRNEVRSAWVERMPASDKRARPLPDDARWAFGPEFAASLGKLDDGQFEKAMRRIVDIITTPPGVAPGWDEHQLRTGTGGGDAPRVRDDGARCIRVEVEKNTAAARRLHYWRLPAGSVEFSRVVLHDDMEP